MLQTLFISQKLILTLSETHIRSTNTGIFNIQGFKFIQRNRQTGDGGGVATYLSDDLKWKR